MTKNEHHSFEPFSVKGDIEKDEKDLLDTAQAYLNKANGSIFMRYSNLANVSALLNWYLRDINWVGFYLRDKDDLILGPFNGLPACVKIHIGEGVCGKCFETKESILVEDVHRFPGHIACDSASNSELVVPILVNGEFVAELDMDSPKLNRFTVKEQKVMIKLCKLLADHWD